MNGERCERERLRMVASPIEPEELPYFQWANADCLDCGGTGGRSLHEPCHVCIVGVWE